MIPLGSLGFYWAPLGSIVDPSCSILVHCGSVNFPWVSIGGGHGKAAKAFVSVIVGTFMFIPAGRQTVQTHYKI
eukprot:11383891-Karenia_brevis.AAC.1